MLALAHVKDVFVMCCSHAEAIKEYIESTKWASTSSPFTMNIINSPESYSIGDVLRELDAKQVIKSDFILVSGDIVSNVSMLPILERHYRLRQEQKNETIMTMLLRESSPFHRSRAWDDAAVYLIDPRNRQCLFYQETNKGASRLKKLYLDEHFFLDHQELQVRNDLIDCHISICSRDVLALFTENFDYQHLRRDFLRGVLTSDLLGKTIHCEIIRNSYSACVSNLQTYDAVSKDVIARWAYPFCPDSNLLDGQTYKHQRGGIFKEDGVVLARSCVINRGTVIGADTQIGEGSIVTRSIMGRGCRIGRNVKIESSYIWNNVEISDGCTITNAIVADGVFLGNLCHLHSGCVVSFGLQLARNSVVPQNARLVMSDTSERNASVKELLYEATDSESEDPQTPISSLIYSTADLTLSDSSLSSRASSENCPRRRRSSATTATSASEDSDEERPSGDVKDFIREAKASLERAFREAHDVDTAALELSTLRMTYNVAFHEMRAVVAGALYDRIGERTSGENVKVAKACKDLVSRYGALLLRVVFTPADQIELLSQFQQQGAKQAKGGDMTLKLMMELYNADRIDEECILKWYNEDKSAPGSAQQGVRNATTPFIEWLQGDEDDEGE